MTTIARKRGWLAAAAALAIACGANVSRAADPPPDDLPIITPPPVIEIPPPPVLPPPPPIPTCTGIDCNPTTPPQGHHETPEPATLITGLVGGSLAGFYGLRRRKRLNQEEAAD